MAHHRFGCRGFSLVEIVIALVIGVTLTAIALPVLSSVLKTLRSGGDAQDLSGAVSLAKMRAAATFTRTRVFADLSSRQFRIETWTLLSGRSSNCWVADGDSQCASSYSGGSLPPGSSLSSGVTFGFGSLGTSPSGETIAQGPTCQTDAQTIANRVGSISNSACIVFNSRAVPVDSAGAATSANLYATDGSSVYGVTVTSTGLIRTWRSSAATANWQSC
jgi:prepilin-type N-terminal cleavage/methylation domain-containing protein